MTKVTEQMIRDIRTKRRKYRIPVTELAEMYGLERYRVMLILRGEKAREARREKQRAYRRKVKWQVATGHFKPRSIVRASRGAADPQ